jgi:hypothetical protein
MPRVHRVRNLLTVVALLSACTHSRTDHVVGGERCGTGTTRNIQEDVRGVLAHVLQDISAENWSHLRHHLDAELFATTPSGGYPSVVSSIIGQASRGHLRSHLVVQAGDEVLVVSCSGDLAYMRGTFAIGVSTEGALGTFTAVWRRERADWVLVSLGVAREAGRPSGLAYYLGTPSSPSATPPSLDGPTLR